LKNTNQSKKIKRGDDEIMKVFKFKTISAANKKKSCMKRMYGYTPSVFKVRNINSNKKTFVVVKPSGLKRVR